MSFLLINYGKLHRRKEEVGGGTTQLRTADQGQDPVVKARLCLVREVFGYSMMGEPLALPLRILHDQGPSQGKCRQDGAKFVIFYFTESLLAWLDINF